jgi:hypothetical protein
MLGLVRTGRRDMGSFLLRRARVHSPGCPLDRFPVSPCPCIALVAAVQAAQGPSRKLPTSRLDIVQISKAIGFDCRVDIYVHSGPSPILSAPTSSLKFVPASSVFPLGGGWGIIGFCFAVPGNNEPTSDGGYQSRSAKR